MELQTGRGSQQSPTLSEGKEEECISKKPIPGARESFEGSLTRVSASQRLAVALAEGMNNIEVHMQQQQIES